MSDSSYAIKSLEQQLKECNAKIGNIMQAIEMGIFNETTQARLTELEALKNETTLSIAKEKNKTITFTKDQVKYWLYRFSNMDMSDETIKENFINSFINQIVIDKDHMIIAYNLTDKTSEISLDALLGSALVCSMD